MISAQGDLDPVQPAAEPRLSLRGIRKVYPTVVANDGIDLDVLPGQIHAVLGENGAGKSTLMKIIYGVTQPTDGELRWHGQPLRIDSPAQARRLGIGMVFQHFSLFETLSVAENVALGLDGRHDLDALARDIETVSARYGLPVQPHRLVHALSVGERQRVEIVRCLLQQPKLLIMDEPTSVLTPQAVQKLFETLRQLAAEGCSILYISHKLDEIQSLCDVATVLRDGRVSGRCVPANETPASMARMMIGRDLPVCVHGPSLPQTPARLRVRDLSLPSDEPFGIDLQSVSLEVFGGEIVGIAGVSGNGQQELLRAISGEQTVADAAAVSLAGVDVGHLGPAQRRALGLCFVPEERLGRGAVPDMSLAENALLTAHRHGLARRGLLDRGAMARFAAACIERFAVKAAGPQAAARSLSGGNLQKFIVGRELMQRPALLVAAQPTWGVDVGAAAFIRQSLIDLRNVGAAVLVVSEELDELFEICDRIAVLAGGRLSPLQPLAQTSVEEIGTWMSGLWPQNGALLNDAPRADAPPADARRADAPGADAPAATTSSAHAPQRPNGGAGPHAAP